ncbi:MAG: hypothetical protein CVU17_02810 [Betaproteobacteria bacterium HGW-Betaproteobacteria-11]|nr:MAG: hypothetical protein CVU17_02810 [Betaproteobacteria bacterium HGW-Betaproteobacteria-11]
MHDAQLLRVELLGHVLRLPIGGSRAEGVEQPDHQIGKNQKKENQPDRHVRFALRLSLGTF